MRMDLATSYRDQAGLILLYHRIAPAELDPWGLAVSPQHFGEHLDLLCKHWNVLPLTHAIEALQNRTLPRRTVIVTFDDGYADNLYNAKPLLSRHGVPATVFLTSGYIGSGREFWWDEIERMLLGPVVLPEELSIVANGRTSRWTLGEARFYPDDCRRSDCHCRVKKNGALSERLRFCYAVHAMLRMMCENERRTTLKNLALWAGVPVEVSTDCRSLSLEEVRALIDGGLVEAGSHTVTHPVLSAMPLSGQVGEVRQSKREIEQLLGRQVRCFAYPYGCCTVQTASVVGDEGFLCACSAQPGVLTFESSLFALPRIKVEDWGSEELSKVLSALLGQ